MRGEEGKKRRGAIFCCVFAMTQRLRRHNVPPDDAPLPFPHFAVLRASAGSGKTYALAGRFVLFLLSGPVPNNGLGK
jgi:hypothetical protein